MILAEPRVRRSVEDIGGRIALARLQLVVAFQHVGVVQEPVHVAEDAEAIGDLLHDLLRMPDSCRRLDHRLPDLPVKVVLRRTAGSSWFPGR